MGSLQIGDNSGDTIFGDPILDKSLLLNENDLTMDEGVTYQTEEEPSATRSTSTKPSSPPNLSLRSMHSAQSSQLPHESDLQLFEGSPDWPVMNQYSEDEPPHLVPTPTSIEGPNYLTASREADVLRLLISAERLRSERDALRQELSFLQMESTIERQALEARLATLTEKCNSIQDTSRLENVERELHVAGDSIAELSLALRKQESENHRLKVAFTASCLIIQNISNNVSKNGAVANQSTGDFGDSGIISWGENKPILATDLVEHSSDFESECLILRDQVVLLEAKVLDAHRQILDVQRGAHSQSTYNNIYSGGVDSEATLTSRIEELESRVMRRTEQIGIHQHDIKRLECNLKLAEEQISELSLELEAATTDNKCLMEDCRIARKERDMARELVEQLETQNESLSVDLITKSSELESSHLMLRDLEDSICALRASAHQEVATVIGIVMTNVLEKRELSRLLKASQTSESLLLKQLEGRMNRQEQSDHIANHLGAQLKKVTSISRRQEAIILSLINRTEFLDSELRTTAVELNAVSQALSDAQEHALALHRDSTAATESRIEMLQDELTDRIFKFERVERELQETQALISKLRDDQQNLVDQLAEQDAAVSSLGESLRLAELQKTEVSASLEERTDDFERQICDLQRASSILILDLERSKGEAEDLRSQLVVAESKGVEMTLLRDELLQQELSYSKETSSLREEIQSREFAILELETKLNQAMLARTDDLASQQTKLDSVNKELQSALADRDGVKQLLECTRQDLQGHENCLQSLRADLAARQRDLSTLEVQLQETSNLRDEAAQTMKQCEQDRRELKSEVATLRAQLSSVTQESNVSRLELEMKRARQEHEINCLKKIVAELKAQPSVQDTITELKARNEELEESLLSKNAEIEDNDDRFLEVLKERKKLTAKIDSLNRKTHILRKQLEEALSRVKPPHGQTREESETASSILGSAPTSSEPERPLTVMSGSTTSPPNLPPSFNGNPVQKPDTRVPVFRQGTPELSNQATAFVRPQETRAVIGDVASPVKPKSIKTSRKRSIPEDFDPLPPSSAQPIVHSPQPHGLRRALHGIRSGFTPTRNSLARSPVAKNSASPFGLTDITNSPRVYNSPAPQNAASKGRSWLGKMRGEADHREQILHPSAFSKQSS